MVFGPVGCFNDGLLLQERLLSSPAFRHASRKRHRSNGEHSRPGLQSEKGLVFRFPDEWPEAMQRAPNRDGWKNENAGRRLTLEDTEGRKSQDRSAIECE